MKTRRTHYETAFQSHLDARGTPYVAIEDVRHLGPGRTGIKSFDYIVYPSSGRPQLVDVKGRKSSRPVAGDEWRQKSWVTRADLDGLSAWGEVFGPEYQTAFVFAYWLAGDQAPTAGGAAGSEVVRFAGRSYSFWVVDLANYVRHQRTISKSWDTVAVPRGVFRRIAVPLGRCWLSSPC